MNISRFQATKDLQKKSGRRTIPPIHPTLEIIEEQPFIPPQPRNDSSIEPENKYKLGCCCGEKMTDRRVLLFIASILISLIIITFSCYQLTRENIDCNSENTYVGLITLIIGVWLKSPV